MPQRAHTPEELETLLEDAFLLRDPEAVAALFAAEAVALVADGHAAARGSADIARAAAAMWKRDGTYLADPQRVLQAGETALVLGPRSVSVARRQSDRSWRYAISLLAIDHQHHHRRERR
jgi:ketosteroid isomerase-like protein